MDMMKSLQINTADKLRGVIDLIFEKVFCLYSLLLRVFSNVTRRCYKPKDCVLSVPP